MSAIKGVDFIQKKITPLLNSVLTNKQRLLQSTFALRTSLYYRHPANTDSCWMLGENFRRLTETNSRYHKLLRLRTYKHLSRSRRHYSIAFTLVITDINQHLVATLIGRIFSDHNLFLPLPLFVSVTLVEKWVSRFLFNIISIKLPYLLAKNSQDVLNVHKLEF